MDISKPLLSNKTYDTLKWTVAIALPAIASFYFGLAAIWGLPYGDEVVGTLAVLATLGGALMGISTKQYKNDEEANATYDGALVVNESDPMKDVYALKIDAPLSELRGKNALHLKIEDETAS